MKCANCYIEVAPNFVASIVDNRCPACGHPLMEGADYKKLMALQKQLASLGLGLDESTLTKVAAAITSRFELTPREESAAKAPVDSKAAAATFAVAGFGPSAAADADDQPRTAPRAIKPISSKASVRSRIEALIAIDRDLDPDVDLDEDGPINSGSAASIVKEWGLDKGGSANVAFVKPDVFDNDLNSVFADLPLQGDDHGSSRMSRASALGETANKFGIKPIRRS